MNGTIPSEFSSLHALIDLRLYRNQFRGNLSHFSHLENLKALNLLSNLFSGSIPSQMGNLRGLSVLALSFNSLTGTIPNEIFSLSNLTTLSLTSNLFTGTLPSGFGLLPLISLDLGVNQFSGIIPSEIHFNLLTFFFVSINLLSGTIPFSLTSSTMLRGISLSNNWLNGTLYPEFGSFIHLNDFDVGTNLLTGSIPSDYGSLTQLKNLRLWNNGFTGAIPQQIYSCTSLTFLFLSNNYLTGTIPSELSLLSKLFYLNFRVNALHGYLPSQIGALTDLGYLLLDNNMFQGSIPSTIVSLKHLRSFDCSTNSLTSSFPSVLGSLTDLTFLSLSANSLTGTLPSSLNNLRKLNTLKLYQNRFRGKINFQLESFPQLEQFFVQKNHFHGTLDSFFSNPENSPLSSIVYFDVSDNHFSGSIPANLFRHSNLSIISMSLNCFKDELPSTMCESSRAEVISMTGLGAANGCSNAVEIPFTGVSLGQILLGSIPECLWLLSNLNTLSLAGNGLTGTISQLASAHSLTSLILSHNYLNGTIPVWIQTKNLTVLDLSRNKLTGDIHHLEFQTENNSTSTNTLELLVNRLSGHVDQSLNRYSYLDILSGNIFGCDNIPSRDENSKYYSCGSTEYGQAMSLAVAIAGLVALTGGFYWIMHLLGMKRTQLPVCCSPWLSRSFSDFETVVQYMKFYSQAKRSSMMFGSFLFDLMRSFCLLLLLWIVTSLPIYILKILDSSSDDPDYVTYTHLYQWLWSLAFLSGSVPAVLLILMCVISLIGFCIMINHLNSQYPFIPKSSIHSAEESIPIFPHHHRWLVFFTVIINLGVVGTMNGLYLWSTLRDLSTSAQVGIQFGFAFSCLLWTFAVRGLIGTNIKESRYGVWLFLILYLLNSVVIPCVVTALSSPSCYQVSLD
jgi:Leucine-rich repeat (LRR) protein